MKKTYKIIFITIFYLILQFLFSDIVFGKEDPVLKVKVYINDEEKTNNNDTYEIGLNDTISIRATADDGEDTNEVTLTYNYSVKIDLYAEGDILTETENQSYFDNEITDTIGDGNNNVSNYVTFKAEEPGSTKINISAITEGIYHGIGATSNETALEFGRTTKAITVKVIDPIESILREKAKEIDKLDLGGPKCIIDHTQNRDVFNKLVEEKIPDITGDVTLIKELIERGYYSTSSSTINISGFIGCKWYDGSLGTTFVPLDSENVEKIKEAYKKQTGKELEIISDSLYQDSTYEHVPGYGYIQVDKYKSKKLYNVIRAGEVSEDEVAYQACDMFIISKGAEPIYIIFSMLTERINYQEGEDIEFTEDDLEGIDNVNNNSSEMDKVSATFKAIYSVAEGEDRETFDFTDVLTDIDNYIPSSEDTPEEFVSKVNVILTIITSIGMVVSILILAVLGIKYMLGSVEEKAEYKKDMIPYVVGAVLLFGITAIVKAVQQIGESINNI